MGTYTASHRLPVIKFSGGQENDPTTGALVRAALEEYGCFEAVFDRVPDDLRRAALDGTKQLFDLPLPVKLRNRSDKPYHGYVGQYAMVPLYESLGIPDALAPNGIKNFTNLLWPEGHPEFSESMRSFSEQLSELDKEVRRMVIESLGLEKYTDEHLNSADYLVRVQKYAGPQSPETKLGLTSHTDKNIVTILYPNEVLGLELLSKDGQWFPADPSTNSFIVMIGESLRAWTNGRLHAPHHRVMMTGDEARYSIGLFSVPKKGYIIKAPEEMIDDEHPLLFKPYDHVKFLEFYYTKAGQASPNALKDYCGVN
ncbi:probable 2-oxoglutarate-dependent dioxygenase AOP1 [Andrographis paniculata]|uniref:probable 2-oxoglutarate-dependent dioxygenase AOP1 n=1 Tax=Andrographis paniculata TaxID=175694 RepID=UPI0021E89943|nr:probable 2-oxoglutarate-dependent dioxygenase AOP1 [Andrographis paniculata]